MATNRIHNYILRIQHSNERTKKRFIVVASTLSMLVVILLWIVYLNLTLPSLVTPNTETATTGGNTANEVTESASSPSFFGVLTRGASIIGGNIVNQMTTVKDGIMNEFSKLGTLATKKNETIVKPNPTSFEPNTALDPIPSTKLPE